jgi:hypothetical protein
MTMDEPEEDWFPPARENVEIHVQIVYSRFPTPYSPPLFCNISNHSLHLHFLSHPFPSTFHHPDSSLLFLLTLPLILSLSRPPLFQVSWISVLVDDALFSSRRSLPLSLSVILLNLSPQFPIQILSFPYLSRLGNF